MNLTSKGLARLLKIIVGVSLSGAVVGAGFAIASAPQWWATLIWAIAGLILLALLAGLWFAVGSDATATESLQKTGVETSAALVDASTSTWAVLHSP